MAVVLIFNHVYWFSQKNTLGKLVTMATRKHLFLIYKIENFANTQFWKVTKFQGASLFRCGVLSHLLGMGWKTPPHSAYRVNEHELESSPFTRWTQEPWLPDNYPPELVSTFQAFCSGNLLRSDKRCEKIRRRPFWLIPVFRDTLIFIYLANFLNNILFKAKSVMGRNESDWSIFVVGSLGT